MALQTFTAGQVLTAAQVSALQTNDFNQTVSTKTANYTLVVGDRGTRLVGNGTSITFTVDNSIFTAGDTLKIHNINSTALTIAAGAGVTINAAAGLTMSQYQEATLFATSASSFILFESTASSAQGLTLINTTSFSGVASFSLATNTFSSTYDNYRIVFNKLTSPGNAFIYMRLRASGTDNTSAVHNWSWYGTRSNNTSFTNGAQNSTFIGVSSCREVAFGGLSLDLYSPFVTDVTGMTAQWNGGEAGQFNFGSAGGVLYNTTSYDAATFYLSAASTFSGQYSVYGYNK